jgi:hypothetical protein
MNRRKVKTRWRIAAIAILILVSGGARAQDTTLKKRIRIPSATQGSVGGDSHSSYVVRARKGQTLTVQLSWRRERTNSAELMVRQSGDFFNPEPVEFGKASDDGRRWTGKIPKTGDYYIYVIAYPSARYIVRVTAK